jgi:hypothetical protein
MMECEAKAPDISHMDFLYDDAFKQYERNWQSGMFSVQRKFAVC